MSIDEEGVLRRWSRLKREARDVAPEPAADAAPEEEEEPFDPASLPPVESLGADSDYSAFLKPRVPKALRLAALRRAWTTDPAITGYRTLADYDWDFNAPGYGQLRPTDQPKALAEAMFRHLRRAAQETETVVAQQPDDPDPSPEADGTAAADTALDDGPTSDRT